MADVYERINTPGYHQGNTYTPSDLFASMQPAPGIHGCTLGGGQGVVLLGSFLARGSDKKYYKWATGADAVDLPAGVTLGPVKGLLMTSADLGGAGSDDQQGNLVTSGVAKLQKVIEANSTADIGTAIGVAITATTGGPVSGARIDVDNDFFSFG